MSRISQLTEEVNDLRRELSKANATLDCIVSHLQRTSPTGTDNEEEHMRKRRKVDDSNPPLLQCLCPLNGESI